MGSIQSMKRSMMFGISVGIAVCVAVSVLCLSLPIYNIIYIYTYYVLYSLPASVLSLSLFVVVVLTGIVFHWYAVCITLLVPVGSIRNVGIVFWLQFLCGTSNCWRIMAYHHTVFFPYQVTGPF